MKIPIVSLLSIACLALALPAGVPYAQTMGESECREACAEQRRTCVERCAEHPDPIDCEARCDDAAEDCAASCRD
jgi:hypothetical protein